MKKYIITIALLLGVLIGGYVIHEVRASVFMGNEYNYKYISSSNASSTGMTQLKSIQGSLGSIVYTASSTVSGLPLITVYDVATTTASASTTLTKVAELGGSNKTVGTYQFDVVFTNGMSLWVNPVFDGTLTVTWR